MAESPGRPNARSREPVRLRARTDPTRATEASAAKPPSPASKLTRGQLEAALCREIKRRGYSFRTEQAYVHWVRRFFAAYPRKHPSELTRPEITEFISHLATVRRSSASTQTQALSALIFFVRHVLEQPFPWLEDLVRSKRPERIPMVLSRNEVTALLAQMRGIPQLMAALLYGSGLRLLECCTLRVKDLDFDRKEIVVRDGKGRKDRVTMIPAGLGDPLADHLRRVHSLFVREPEHRRGYVRLPDALDRKFPNAGREWPWQWVFPAARCHLDRKTGVPTGITSTRRCFNGQCDERPYLQVFPNRPAVMRFVTRSPPISSNEVMISARFKSCWATETSARR